MPRRDLFGAPEDRSEDIDKALRNEPERAAGLANVSHVRRAEYSASAGWVGLRAGYPRIIWTVISKPCHIQKNA